MHLCMSTDASLLETLLGLERAGWDSLCEATGARFYGELMLPQALMVLANGMVLDRDTVVSALSQSPPWRTYEIRDVRLLAADSDNALVVYTGVGYRDGQEPAFTGAMASTYHRTADGWKLLLYQQTQIAD
jgi:hypothetical protein